MKNSKKALLCLLACALAVTGCKTQKEPAVADNAMLVRSTQTLDSLYAHYSAPGTCLLRENYPSDVEGYTATYLASEEQKNRPNLYSYLWPGNWRSWEYTGWRSRFTMRITTIWPA